MVKDVTKLHKRHLWGLGMLECVCVQGFTSYRILSFWRGKSKFGVDVEGVYST